ncbi:MAG: hypothetical protein FWE67_02705 [Planctomycetaceae bacterium]|nr:hypothetical protein [Planctomycetaceae bacterium]
MTYRNRIVLIISLLFAVLFPAVIFAQPNAQMFRSKVWQDGMRRSSKTVLKSMWDGKGYNLFAVQLLQEKEVRDSWGVSDDQYQNLQGATAKSMMSSENAAIMKEIMELQKDKDFFTDNGDPKKQERFFELQSKMVSTLMDTAPLEIDKNLSAEQKKKMQEFQLSTMGEFPIVSTSMFNALDLSEDQTKKMDAIKKELEPQFDKLMDDLIDSQMKLNEKVMAAAEKEGIKNPQDNRKLFEDLIQRVSKEDPEIQKLMQEFQSKNQLFITQFKFKVFDILTDEQLARLEKIVSNQPDYVKNWVQKMKKMMGQAGGGEASNAFLNSWKPGEPIPAEYKKARENKKFPAKE